MYRAVTRNIEVVVTPRFVADRSSPENNYFFWAYTISITNKGDDTVQLKTRHWRITDAHGRHMAASKRYAAPESWARSRCLRRVKCSNIPAGSRCRRRRDS